MNEYEKALMDKPSIETPYCALCGRHVQSRHHIVPRSHGGEKGPTITVCGYGNEHGCHGLLHSHMLHLRWDGEWEYLLTLEPTKYDEALQMSGWRPLPAYTEYETFGRGK